MAAGFKKRERTEEEKARLDRATKRVTIRLIDGQWDVEFDIVDGEHPISRRELKFLKQALHVRHGQLERQNRLRQRQESREKHEAENPADVAETISEPQRTEGSEIQVGEDEILLTQ